MLELVAVMCREVHGRSATHGQANDSVVVRRNAEVTLQVTWQLAGEEGLPAWLGWAVHTVPWADPVRVELRLSAHWHDQGDIVINELLVGLTVVGPGVPVIASAQSVKQVETSVAAVRRCLNLHANVLVHGGGPNIAVLHEEVNGIPATARTQESTVIRRGRWSSHDGQPQSGCQGQQQRSHLLHCAGSFYSL